MNVGNPNNSNSNSELIKRTEVENTPFTVITIENESFVTLGKYRLTEKFETEKEAIESASKITWDNIMQVITIMILNIEKETINN